MAEGVEYPTKGDDEPVVQVEGDTRGRIDSTDALNEALEKLKNR